MRLAFLVLLFPLTLLAGEPVDSAAQVSRCFKTGEKFHGQDQTSISYGSGTVLKGERGKSLVLTNWHVCPTGDAVGYKVVLGDRVYRKVRWLGSDEVADLALLEVDAELPAAELADEEPPVGAQLEVFGFESGWDMVARKGKLTDQISYYLRSVKDGHYKSGPLYWNDRGEQFYKTGAENLVSDMVVFPGASGSGVFYKGKMVGVTWGSDFEKTSTHVKLADIKRFMKKMEK
jgi:hypothetical protein